MIKMNNIENFNYINFSASNNNYKAQMHTKLDFFKEPFIFKSYEEKIVFKHVTIDYQGKTQLLTPRKDWYYGAISTEIALGKYEISDESDEDELIIYKNK